MAADFDKHAKILRYGQYKVENEQFIVKAPRIFKKTKEQEIEESTQRIEQLREEIRMLEDEIAAKTEKSEKAAEGILEKAESETERLIEKAEKSAFDRVQKSLDEKDTVLEEKKSETQAIINEAKQQAEQIKQQASQEAEQLKEKARKEGLEQGKTEGFEYSKDEISHMVERLQSIVSATIDERERIMVHSEQQIMKLILSMVRKIVKKLTQEQEGIIINNVKEALSLIRGAVKVFIHVNPDDYDFTLKHKEELIQMIEAQSEVKFIEDPKVDRGGVFIETDIGEVDATIASQLDEIEDKIRFYIPVKVKSKINESVVSEEKVLPEGEDSTQ